MVGWREMKQIRVITKLPDASHASLKADAKQHARTITLHVRELLIAKYPATGNEPAAMRRNLRSKSR